MRPCGGTNESLEHHMICISSAKEWACELVILRVRKLELTCEWNLNNGQLCPLRRALPQDVEAYMDHHRHPRT